MGPFIALKTGIHQAQKVGYQITKHVALELRYSWYKFEERAPQEKYPDYLLKPRTKICVRMKRVSYSLIIALFIVGQIFGQAPTVTSKNWITNGFNFDVDIANGKIYLISDHYYELDLNGNQLYSNTNIDDTGQGTFDFGPAIEVGSDGVVHLINRDGGSGSGGFSLKYSKRESNGTWSVENNLVGSPVARNYVVDVVALDGGEAVYAHTRLTTSDVAGSVYFYKFLN